MSAHQGDHKGSPLPIEKIRLLFKRHSSLGLTIAHDLAMSVENCSIVPRRCQLVFSCLVAAWRFEDVSQYAIIWPMSKLKSGLSALWKWIPPRWRWRLLWLFSDHFVLGANGVVLNERNQVLLAHHVFRDAIAWGLPGGGVKRGEDLGQALRREILEETGLAVQVQHLLQITLEEERPLLSCHFWCSVDGIPRLQVNGELFEAGFYSLDALPGTIDPGQLALIKLAIEVKTKSKPSMVVLPNSVKIR